MGKTDTEHDARRIYTKRIDAATRSATIDNTARIVWAILCLMHAADATAHATAAPTPTLNAMVAPFLSS